MPTTIALDAMGGDHAPAEIVKGAVCAAASMDVKILLVGNEADIKKFLPANYPADKIEIVHAADTIAMDEDPAKSIKSKKNCSINVAVRLVKEKKADAFVSAGNTGACMAGALLGLGRIKGIERPAIATIFPTMNGKVVLLDMGANSDCKPHYLAQFGLMGSIYAEKFLKIHNPRVSILSIGEEEEKGNTLTTEATPLLKKMPINFIGNIEGKDILSEHTDVIVCDGFVGNVVLKFGEGLVSHMLHLFKSKIKESWIAKIGLLFLIPVFNNIKKQTDYSEYGAAPLLGVQGVAMITHGRADAKVIKNAVRAAIECVISDIVGTIRQVEQMLIDEGKEQEA